MYNRLPRKAFKFLFKDDPYSNVTDITLSSSYPSNHTLLLTCSGKEIAEESFRQFKYCGRVPPHKYVSGFNKYVNMMFHRLEQHNFESDDPFGLIMPTFGRT